MAKGSGGAGRRGGDRRDDALLRQRERLVNKDAELRSKYAAMTDRVERRAIVGRLNDNLAKIKHIDRQRSARVGAQNRAAAAAHMTPEGKLARAREEYQRARDAFTRVQMPSDKVTRAYRKAEAALKLAQAAAQRD